jgi:hypothetical protein
MTFKISIPTDGNGLTGRECPVKDCLGYFKVKFGTGLKGDNIPCVCPYCGHRGHHDTFWTQEQLQYAQSIAMREVSDLMVQELKKMEFNIPARGAFGIGISMKVEPGLQHPIRCYREKKLETEVTCSSCTLEYAIYGVFGYCPDCGMHNSFQILEKNLELAEKELRLAADMRDGDLRTHLIGDALENAVSAFDGFGRKAAESHKSLSSHSQKASTLSFQNLTNADGNVRALFGFGLSDGVTADEWKLLVRCFQKRHLLAHRMGVIDEKYVAAVNDPAARVGRKITIESSEVSSLLSAVNKLGEHLSGRLANLAQAAVKSPGTLK